MVRQKKQKQKQEDRGRLYLMRICAFFQQMICNGLTFVISRSVVWHVASTCNSHLIWTIHTMMCESPKLKTSNHCTPMYHMLLFSALFSCYSTIIICNVSSCNEIWTTGATTSYTVRQRRRQ